MEKKLNFMEHDLPEFSKKKKKNTFLKHAKLIVLAFVFCLSRIKSLRESAEFLS